MRISDKGKVKRFLMPVLVLAFFLVGEYLLGRLLVPVNSSVYFKDEMKEIYESGERADLLILGTSRVYHSFAPEVFEEKMGFNCVVNGGTATQRPKTSYLFLKDLDRKISPKVVVLSLQWNSLIKDPTVGHTTESTLMVYDKLFPLGKLECIISELGSEAFPELFPIYRYRYDLKFAKIRENHEKRKNYMENGRVMNTSADQYYHGKGFIYANTKCATGNIPIMDEGANSFNVDDILKENLVYIDRIVEYCKKHGIEIYLISAPMSMENLYHLEGYQEAVDYYTRYAEEKGLIYHNLNYLKDREEWLGDDMMTDYVHLNGEGAYKVSEIYAEILQKDMRGEDTSGYFYKDLAELKENVERVVAVGAKRTIEDGVMSVEIQSLQNDDIHPLYRAEISTDDGEDYEVVCDWSSSAFLSFEVPDGGFRLKVTAALSPDDPSPAWMEYNIN